MCDSVRTAMEPTTARENAMQTSTEVRELKVAIRAIEFVKGMALAKRADIELVDAIDSLKTAISIIEETAKERQQ
jgi:hypothetical protein